MSMRKELIDRLHEASRVATGLPFASTVWMRSPGGDHREIKIQSLDFLRAAEALSLDVRNGAADVLERVAAASHADPTSDDLSVELAMRLAEAETELAAWRKRASRDNYASSWPPPADEFASLMVCNEIAIERKRQREEEGWTPARDDEYRDGAMAKAAACYAYASTLSGSEREIGEMVLVRDSARHVSVMNLVARLWPTSWAAKWWKPKGRRRNLVRAAALIIAEIERLDRAEARAKQGGGDAA